jgi:hypothetical protein
MKKLLTILALTIGLGLNAQIYVSPSFSYYNGPGTFEQNGMATLEIGKSFNNVFFLGVAGGVTSFSGMNTYVEFRPSAVLYTYKKLSVIGSLGAGYVWDSPEKVLTEYCGTISYTLDDRWAVNFFGGGYNFNGKESSSKYTFVGTGFTFTIPRNDDPNRFPGMVQARF